MGNAGGVTDDISENIRMVGGCDHELTVYRLNLCPARGRHHTSSKCKVSDRSQGVTDTRFLRVLPNCDLWFMLIPSLCP